MKFAPAGEVVWGLGTISFRSFYQSFVKKL